MHITFLYLLMDILTGSMMGIMNRAAVDMDMEVSLCCADLETQGALAGSRSLHADVYQFAFPSQGVRVL